MLCLLPRSLRLANFLGHAPKRTPSTISRARTICSLSWETAADVNGVPRPLSFLLPRGHRTEYQHYVFAEDEEKPLELEQQWRTSTTMAGVLAKADGWLYESQEARSPLLALWKPRGVITTMASHEPNNLNELLELSLPCFGWPADRPPQPVGRLDKATSGLLLLTDNGDVSRILRAPKGIPKTYIATAAPTTPSLSLSSVLVWQVV